MSASKILDLRQLLVERFPQEPASDSGRLGSGLEIFDQALGGGLTKSAITEVTVPWPNAGSATLIAGLLRQADRAKFFLALIDGRDSFDPESLGAGALRRLLWVRCRAAREAMQAADLLLRDGNFSLVILDLLLNPPAELRKIPAANWYRLQRLVEAAPSALLAFTRQSMISSAQWKLVLENRWQLSHLEEETAALPAHFRFRIARAQLHKWKSETALSRAS